jgi:DNA-binding SARP family transcriptional activator
VTNAMDKQKKLTIVTLGTLEIHSDGVLINDLSQKAKALLVYLARTKQTFTRVYLAELLWPERDEKQALSNLRTLLARLPASIKEHLNISRDTVAMAPTPLAILDANIMEQKFSQVAGSRDLSQSLIDQLEDALSLYQGEFMHGFYMSEFSALEDWVTQERESLQNQLEGILKLLQSYYLKNQSFTESLRVMKRLLQLDPLSEETHRQMIWLLAQQGHRSAALAHYEAYRHYLSKELDIAPEMITTELYEQIKIGQCNNQLWLNKLNSSTNLPATAPLSLNLKDRAGVKLVQLQRISLFQATPSDILLEIADLLQDVKYNPNETIFSKGEPGDCLYIIVQGQVRIHDEKRTLNVLAPHDIFGEMALLDVAPRLASATTITQTFLWKLEQTAFYKLMEARPEISHVIVKMLTRRLRERVNDVMEMDAQIEHLIKTVDKSEQYNYVK